LDFNLTASGTLAVWFKKKNNKKVTSSGSPLSTSSIKNETPVVQLKNPSTPIIEGSEALQNPSTPTEALKNPFAIYSSNQKSVGHNGIIERQYYDKNSIINDILEEYLGTDGKEGNVVGHIMTGHVDNSFLNKALSVGAVVGLVVLKKSTVISTGTCTIFSGRKLCDYVILTNNHVIASINDASQVKVYLDHNDSAFPSYSDNPLIKFIELDPNTVFITNKALDYTVVAVSTKEGHDKLDGRTVMKFSELSLGVGRFEGVNLVSHPRGKPLTYSIRGSNYLMTDEGDVYHGALNSLVRHGAYSLCGSSGAILFDDHWKPLALHNKKGEAVRGKNGEMQKVDSNVLSGSSNFVDGVDDCDDILYRYNRAISMESIVADMKTKLVNFIDVIS